METVVFDQTPLADYLRDEGEEEGEQADWAPAETVSEPTDSSSPPLPSSPTFAPTGRPVVKAKFRSKPPNPLQLQIPKRPSRLAGSARRSVSTAVASRIERADTNKFLEQFRYTIVASQLLSGHSIFGGQQGLPAQNANGAGTVEEGKGALSSNGAVATVIGALVVACALNWFLGGGYTHLTKKRLVTAVVLVAVLAVVAQVYIRRQWLRYRREQALSEVTTFVGNSQDLDSASSAAIALIQEVELVSRGYRISMPLPPISRIEDRSQTRKCGRLRKALRSCLADLLDTYKRESTVLKGLAEQLDLEKYYDIYDISDFDISDAMLGFDENEFEDADSLRTLKILAARFHTMRKMILCALLALDASGTSADLPRWSTAVEAIRSLNAATKTAYEDLRTLLVEEESFPSPPTPKLPLTPGRERWRSQLRKLNSLSTGVRGLQAKLQLLREESDRALNDSDENSNVVDLGSNLLAQYESLGTDLRQLMQAWEEGKAALATGIDRTEKRLSSMSTLLSPASSLSGLTTVEEGVGGGALDALKALTGESPQSTDFGSPESVAEEVFEAVALPVRPRSMLSREERIAKMREERERKEVAREKAEANRGMLRELEMVINLRPKLRTNTAPAGRIVSMP